MLPLIRFKKSNIYNALITFLWPRFSLSLAALCALTVTCLAEGENKSAPSQNLTKQNVILILDGSGSMRGRIKNIPKMDIARKALGQIFRQSSENLRLGVMVYGHRKKPACSGVEVVLPLGQVQPKAYSRRLAHIRPHGKTPTTTALEMAANTLDYKNRKATIVLLSDGFENCRKDPCKATKTLKKEAHNLTIHVVGLSRNPKETKKLQCIADNSGGEFQQTVNFSQLKTSLSEVFRLIEASATAPTVAGDENAQSQDPPETIKTKRDLEWPAFPEKPGLRLTARLAGNEDRLRQGLEWHIYSTHFGLDGKREKIGYNEEAEALIELAPGKYYVEVRYGLVTERRIVESVDGPPVNEAFILNAGTLKLRATAKAGGTLLKQIYYRLYEAGGSQQGEAEVIAHSNDAVSLFHLPAGDYRIVAQYGKVQLERIVAVKAGNVSDLTLIMNVGVLELSAKATTDGDPLKRIFYTLYEKADASAEDETLKYGKEILRTAADSPRFRLASGHYYVIAEHHLARQGQWLQVHPGEVTKTVINMQVGALKLTSLIVGASHQINEKIRYEIYAEKTEFDGALKEIMRTSRPKTTVFLTEGDYEIIGRYGKVNVSVHKKIKIQAGELTELAVTHQAGLATFSLLRASDGRPEERVFWLIYDDTGNEIWRTSQPSPTLVLKAGKYKVVVEKGTERLVKQFTLLSGDKKTVEIVARESFWQ